MKGNLPWVGGIALVLLVAGIGTTIGIKRQQQATINATGRADRLELLLQDVAAREQRLLDEKKALAAVNAEQQRQIAKLKVDRPIVPPLPEIPSTSEDLVNSLVGLGLQEGVKVVDLEVIGDYKVVMPGGSLFHYWDAQKVVEWGEQAKRVPFYERRQAADQAIIDKYGALVAGLNLEMTKTEEAQIECNRKYAIRTEQFESVKLANGALTKEMNLRSLRTKVIFGVTVPVVAWLTYQVTKR